MAKSLIIVESLVESFLITGLEKNEPAQTAFVQFCKSEYGAIAGDNVESFSGLKITGKGDKAKGKLNRGTVEFKGGHNTAIVALSAASAIYDLESSIGRMVGKADCSEICKSWWEGKTAKRSGNVTQSAPKPSFAEVAARNPGEPVDDGTIEVGADEANNVNA